MTTVVLEVRSLASSLDDETSYDAVFSGRSQPAEASRVGGLGQQRGAIDNEAAVAPMFDPWGMTAVS